MIPLIPTLVRPTFSFYRRIEVSMAPRGCVVAVKVLVVLVFFVHTYATAAGPQPLYSGFVDLHEKPGSSLYYAYWEATNSTGASHGRPDTGTDRPIVLWLQGGPGCSSTFGAFYELGPYIVDEKGQLVQNPFAWNQNFGLLIFDQPIGTGYSVSGSEVDIPTDMAGMSQDLYEGLWVFFNTHKELQERPLFITGESYAGKYVPSLAHFILQAEGQVWKQPAGGRKYCRYSRAKGGKDKPSSRPAAAAAAVMSRWLVSQPAREHTMYSATHLSQRLVNSLVSFTSSLQQVCSRIQQWPFKQQQQQQQQQDQSSAEGAAHQQEPMTKQRRGANIQQQQQQRLMVQSKSVPPCWQPARHVWVGDVRGVPAPNFHLLGLAIGNGLTDPLHQTRALASVAFNMGLVTDSTQSDISQRTEEIVQLVKDGLWQQATNKRSELLQFIQEASGVATLLDVRRTEAYDAGKTVDTLLDSAAVRQWMGAPSKGESYSSCSEIVERAMSSDVMRSCSILVEDLLAVLPVLLYQGQFDAQDGVAGSSEWINRLDWSYIDDFEDSPGQLWYAETPATPATPAAPAAAQGALPASIETPEAAAAAATTTAAAPVAAGWVRAASTLTQVVVRNAGHMVPRDQPRAALAMLQQWVADVLEDEGWGPVEWPTGAWSRQQQQQQPGHPGLKQQRRAAATSVV